MRDCSSGLDSLLYTDPAAGAGAVFSDTDGTNVDETYRQTDRQTCSRLRGRNAAVEHGRVSDRRLLLLMMMMLMMMMIGDAL